MFSLLFSISLFHADTAINLQEVTIFQCTIFNITPNIKILKNIVVDEWGLAYAQHKINSHNPILLFIVASIKRSKGILKAKMTPYALAIVTFKC